MTKQLKTTILAALLAAFGALALQAQVTPAAGFTPPDDTPSFKIGTTIFADFTDQAEPKTTDSDGNKVTTTSFNITRAYVNFTGNLNHLFAFRVTPDITRETGSGSSLNGSYTYRLKYAYGQVNLDDWMTKGSWIRFGLTQTPYIDYTEGAYRYRFQGPLFVDREGFLTSSDLGISGRYAFGGNYGDVMAGIYNGEGYAKPETNDQKAFQVRASFRPVPMGGAWVKGLRIAGFYDADHYVQNAEKTRAVGNITWETSPVNAGFEYLTATDQKSATGPSVDAKGYSAWVVPKTSFGLEGLLRHDELKPDDNTDQKKKRDIVGIAYWPQNLQKVQTAVMLDYENVKYDNFAPAKPDEKRYAIHFLINY